VVETYKWGKDLGVSGREHNKSKRGERGGRRRERGSHKPAEDEWSSGMTGSEAKVVIVGEKQNLKATKESKRNEKLDNQQRRSKVDERLVSRAERGD